MLEHKIAQLEKRLLTARVITKKEISKDASRSAQGTPARHAGEQDVRVPHRRLDRGQSGENKLSNESPVGKAIIGHKKGDVVEVVGAARRPQVQDPRNQGRLSGPGAPKGTDLGSPVVEIVRPSPRTPTARPAPLLARAFYDDPAWDLADPRSRAVGPVAPAAPLPGRASTSRPPTCGANAGPCSPAAARWLPPGRPAGPCRGLRCGRWSRHLPPACGAAPGRSLRTAGRSS